MLPDSYSYQRGETRAAVLRRMQAAMTQTLDRAVGEAQAGTRRSKPARGGDPRLDRREGDRQGRPSGGWSPASIRTGCGQGMKLHADPTVIYPITKGKPLGRRILRSELQAINGYNTYAMAGPAGRTDRQSGPGLDRGGARTRRRPRRSISSPTAPAATSSPTRSPSMMPMSRNGTRSAARAARCRAALPKGRGRRWVRRRRPKLGS